MSHLLIQLFPNVHYHHTTSIVLDVVHANDTYLYIPIFILPFRIRLSKKRDS